MTELQELILCCVVIGYLLDGLQGILWGLFLGPAGNLISCIRWANRRDKERAMEQHIRSSNSQENSALLLGMMTTEDSGTGRIR